MTIYRPNFGFKKLVFSFFLLGIIGGFTACSDVDFQSVGSDTGTLGDGKQPGDGTNPNNPNDPNNPGGPGGPGDTGGPGGPGGPGGQGPGDPGGGPGGPGGPGTEPPNCIPGQPNCPYELYSQTVTVKAPTNKVDIVLVVDDSGSMEQELETLGKNISGFTNVLTNLDWQMCYATTDPERDLGFFKKWKNINSIVLKKNNVGTSAEAIFNTTMSTMSTDDGGGNERAIEVIGRSVGKNANQSCFRNDAALATIILSDEDEKSCGGRCKYQDGPAYDPNRYSMQYDPLNLDWNTPDGLLKTMARTFPDGKIYLNHSIVIKPGDTKCYRIQDVDHPAFYGILYDDLSKKTGGVTGDICAQSSNYVSQLASIGKVTAKALDAVQLKCPPINGTITFDPAISSKYTVTGSRVTFTPGLPPGTKLKMSFYCK